MSFSLLRVPKKAALTALRGLVVGTSCTLALITEDRRRRINQARSVVRNAERIRSSKQYHAAHPALSHSQSTAERKSFDDVMDAAILIGPARKPFRTEIKDHDGVLDRVQVEQRRPDPDAAAERPKEVLTPSAHAPTQSRDRHRDQESASDNAQLSQARHSNVASNESAGPASPTRIRASPRAWGSHANSLIQQPSPALFKRPVPTTSRPGPSAIPDLGRLEIRNIDVHENVRRVSEAIVLGDTSSLEEAVNILRDTLRKQDLTAEEKDALVHVAAPLCSKCQESGMMDDAARALYQVVQLGPLHEADYYACNPQPVIDHAISAAEVEVNKLKAEDGKFLKRERLSVGHKLNRVIQLLLPKFTQNTLSPSRIQDWLPTAEKSMELALDLQVIADSAANVYWRIQHYGADPNGLVTRRFMEGLAQQAQYNRILNTFHLIRYRLAQYEPETWYAVGNLVADALELSPGKDPSKLLKTMLEFCPSETLSPGLPLRTTWVTKLLYCHWQRMRNFGCTLALFRHFEELGGFDKIVHLDGPYRVMIQIAGEAEQWADVDELFKQLVFVKPTTAKEARILGLLALAKAKLGDWNGVLSDFKKMEIKHRVEDVFVPVLHEFIKTHTTRETEDFLKTYIEDLEIPISPFMVNMVANRYGDIRDAHSFIEWIAYCSKKGFEIDAAFGNAILTNCRRRWEFGYPELKLMHRTLAALSPNFVDDVTENDMISAVLRTHRRAKPIFIRREIALVGAKSHMWGKLSSLDDVRVDMRYAFATRKYKQAIQLYKSACKQGVPVDDGHLRIAVKASLKLGGRIQPALSLIKEGKAKGIDVSTATTQVFLTQIYQVFAGDTSDKESVLRQVQNVIASFEENGLSVGHQPILRIAYLLLRAGHFQSAISFGLSTLQRKGISYPDDVPTFQLLLLAYAYKSDVPGMKWTIAGAVHLQYYHKKSVFKALKDARTLLQKQIQTSDVKEALWVVENGLDRVRLQRLRGAEERTELERDVIEIMKQAALETEHQPGSEAFRRREKMLQELDAKARLEEETKARKEAARRAERQARYEAAMEHVLKNQDEASAMETILLENRHDIIRTAF